MNHRKSKLKVLVLCHDVIGKNMAGPGIRYRHIYEFLSKKFDVRLGVFSEQPNLPKDVSVVSEKDYKSFFDRADVIFAQWLSSEMINYARQQGKILIFDLYAPVPVEYLASHGFSKRGASKHNDNEFAVILEMYKNYLQVGQLFTCSNPRQRDFWAGFAVSAGLIKPSSFSSNTNWQSQLVFCPMGIDSARPNPGKLLLREKLPQIDKKDFVLLWTGGIWDWFDAQLIIKAMAKIKDSKIKLVFLGTKHPNAIYKDEMSESLTARQTAQELGLVDKTVFFLDGWIPYEDRAAYFMDANAAIYADKQSLETRFSHRSRVLDHIWSGLPTICSDGDYLSDLIGQKELGLDIKKRSPEAFAEAIKKLSYDKKLYSSIKNNIEKHRKEFEWSATLEPLMSYLLTLDQKALSEKIKNAYMSNKKLNQPLGVKTRVKRSAKMLLLGK